MPLHCAFLNARKPLASPLTVEPLYAKTVVRPLPLPLDRQAPLLDTHPRKEIIDGCIQVPERRPPADLFLCFTSPLRPGITLFRQFSGQHR